MMNSRNLLLGIGFSLLFPNLSAQGGFTLDDLNAWSRGDTINNDMPENRALNFSGDDDYVLIGQVPSYAGSFTIEGRFKGERGAIFNVRTGSSTAIYAEISGEKLRCIIRNPPRNAGGLDIRSNTAVNDGEWHHFMMVKDDDKKLHLYLDGALEASSSGTIPDFDGTPYEVVLGTNVTNNTRYFKGTMDYVRLWSTVRMPGQSGTEGLVAEYNFNQGQAGGDNTSISQVEDSKGSYSGTLRGFLLNGETSNFIEVPSQAKIELLPAENFTLRWNDRKSEGQYDGSFYRPEVPDGYYSLGDFAQRGYGAPPAGSVQLVKPLEEGVLAPPVDFELIWKDSGSGAARDGSFWRPIAPEGYRALGVVCQSGYNKPALDAIRCVRADLLVPGKVGSMIWDDSNTGARTPFSAWTIVGAAANAITCGTFIALTSRDQPGSDSPLLFCIDPQAINGGEAPLEQK